jgi:hypothetical protein
LPRALPLSEFPANEIHVEQRGTAWLVSSHLEAQRQFDTVADALAYADELRATRSLGERLRVLVRWATGQSAL